MQEQAPSTLIASSFKLSKAQAGMSLLLVQIKHTHDPHVIRLCEIGLMPGVQIELLQKGHPGSLILIRFNDIDLCLDETLADNFLVQRVSFADRGVEE